MVVEIQDQKPGYIVEDRDAISCYPQITLYNLCQLVITDLRNFLEILIIFLRILSKGKYFGQQTSPGGKNKQNLENRDEISDFYFFAP